MDKINLPIDPELGQEIKNLVDQGYVILGVESLKGFKGSPDTFFISLGSKPLQQQTIVRNSQRELDQPITPKQKVKDGEPEKAEAQEPFEFIKPVVAAHSTDPSKPTLADMVDRIIKAHKDLGLSGKVLADRCLNEVLEMKDPITKGSLEKEVQNAMQAYLNYELSKQNF